MRRLLQSGNDGSNQSAHRPETGYLWLSILCCLSFAQRTWLVCLAAHIMSRWRAQCLPCTRFLAKRCGRRVCSRTLCVNRNQSPLKSSFNTDFLLLVSLYTSSSRNSRWHELAPSCRLTRFHFLTMTGVFTTFARNRLTRQGMGSFVIVSTSSTVPRG